MIRRFGASGLAGVLLSTILAAPAIAAPPTNDEVGNAIAVALGVTVGPIDTTEATGAADDPMFEECGFTLPVDRSVWFTWTPGSGEGGDIRAQTFGSDYDTTLVVMTGSTGAFDLVGCNDDAGFDLQSAVAFTAEEGVAYTFMVDTFTSTPGGNLFFTVETAPPPVEITLTLDPTGTKTPDGTALVSGTIACSREVAFADIQVLLRQRAGRAVIEGFGFAFVEPCGPDPSPWTAEITGNGIFAGGWADAFALAFTCDLECTEAFIEARIKLRGR